MPFTDPTTTLPADDIEPGKLIGSIIETGETGQRIVITPDDGTPQHAAAMQFYSSDDDTGPATLRTGSAAGSMQITSPDRGHGVSSFILTTGTDTQGPSFEVFNTSGVNVFVGDPGDGTNVFKVSHPAGGALTVDQSGLSASNEAYGRVDIVPTAANTPTPKTVTGLGLTGMNFHAYATPLTSVPGTGVTGVGLSNVTADSLTVWLTRTTTASTGVSYAVIGGK
jgi:hypothetical protein